MRCNQTGRSHRPESMIVGQAGCYMASRAAIAAIIRCCCLALANSLASRRRFRCMAGRQAPCHRLQLPADAVPCATIGRECLRWHRIRGFALHRPF
jgi:hypothetical protein